METIVLVLDESGAKGYADKPEAVPGEVGVAAGIIFLERHESAVAADLEKIVQPISHTGKFHITDLSKVDQGPLRTAIFNYLKAKRARWVYEATYVQGFFDSNKQLRKLINVARSSCRSSVKVSGNADRQLLHTHLLVGAISKAIAFGYELLGGSFHLKVVTDRIDEPIIRDVKTQVEEILKVQRPFRITSPGYDTKTGILVSGSIEMTIEDPANLCGDFSQVSFSVSIEESSLTFAADVLVNSVYYALRNLQISSIGTPLNACCAIEDHELANLVYGCMGATEAYDFSDTLYGYPKSTDAGRS